jgi:hypothetical protein
LKDHPIRLIVDDDLRRSRLTVLFRLLFATPHFVWVALWSVAALFAAVANGIVVLFRGRSAESLHRFLTAYVRYYTHVTAFVFLVANPFPGFVGAPGYPVDVVVDPPESRNRWIALFRVLLALPAVVVSWAFLVALVVLGALGSLAALVTGRMPAELRNLGASCVRYVTRTNAYVLGVTDTYPRTSELRPPTEPESQSFEAAV